MKVLSLLSLLFFSSCTIISIGGHDYKGEALVKDYLYTLKDVHLIFTQKKAGLLCENGVRNGTDSGVKDLTKTLSRINGHFSDADHKRLRQLHNDAITLLNQFVVASDKDDNKRINRILENDWYENVMPMEDALKELIN
jgi:hypothetical protein